MFSDISGFVDLCFHLQKGGVRIRLKRGGHHGSELVSDRGVHHGFEFFRDLNVFKEEQEEVLLSSRWIAVLLNAFGYSEKPLASSGCSPNPSQSRVGRSGLR